MKTGSLLAPFLFAQRSIYDVDRILSDCYSLPTPTNTGTADMTTAAATTLALVSNHLIKAGVNMGDAITIVEYADQWGARVQFASTPANDEHIVAVLHDDHVFAAASSKLSQVDALHRLAGRIRAKSA